MTKITKLGSETIFQKSVCVIRVMKTKITRLVLELNVNEDENEKNLLIKLVTAKYNARKIVFNVG